MSLIEYASRKIRRDTAGNWSSNNPTPLEGEWCLETDTGNVKIGDGSTAWNDLLYTDNVQIGTEKKFFTYKDRTDWGYLPFAFNNAVSQTTYNLLYAEIGDVFEAQHIAAGDSASGAGMFYPTPIPGAYERVGVPDIEFASADIEDSAGRIKINKPDWMLPSVRIGTPFRLKLITGAFPSGLSENDEFYVRTDTGTIFLYTSEAGAIDGTYDKSTYTDSGSGTFRLTQEGITLDDKFQGHWHEAKASTASAGSITYLQKAVDAYSGELETVNNSSVLSPIEDGTNGIPRPTNETRPKTNYSFGYIKAKKI